MLKNTHDLKTKEIELEVEVKDTENIEEEVIDAYSKENPSDFNKIIPQLINALSLEKQEDEKRNKDKEINADGYFALQGKVGQYKSLPPCGCESRPQAEGNGLGQGPESCQGCGFEFIEQGVAVNLIVEDERTPQNSGHEDDEIREPSPKSAFDACFGRGNLIKGKPKQNRAN